MIWTIIVILVILWLLVFFGRNISPGFPRVGGWIHLIIVIAIIIGKTMAAGGRRAKPHKLHLAS